MAGLTAQGFETKSFQNIKAELESKITAAFGVVDFTAGSVVNFITSICAEREADLWAALLAVYNSQYPDTAEGFSLDGICQYNGVTRLAATATTVIADLTGVNKTQITAGSEATAIGIDTTFKLDNDVLIDNEKCFGVRVSVSDLDQAQYSISINNEVFTHNKVIDDTAATIIDALVILINASAQQIVASNYNNTNLLVIDNSNQPMTVFVVAGLNLIDVTVKASFTSSKKGKIPLPAGALTNIQTPVFGWISVYNQLAGDTGRDLETDDELRIRRFLSVRLAGAGTVEAIRARLLNVVGVSAVTVIENDSELTVDNRPPKCFESIVLGGSNDDVAKAIWQAKPAGIKTFGNTQVVIQDSVGNNQSINFSRPEKLFIYATITLTVDQTYLLANNDLIKTDIAAQINSLNVSDDVIYQSLYKSVYKYAGINSATIQIGGTAQELVPPALQSANIELQFSQIAVSDISKITVTVQA